jgi:hypothetical protein
MAFDSSYPVTNSTPWNTLYAGLRNQFTELNNLFSIDGSWQTVTLNSGWSLYTGGGLYYKKDGFGRVYVRCTSSYGLLLVSTGAANPAFTFNSGYRPTTNNVYISRYVHGGTTLGYFYIGTDGTFNCEHSPANMDMVHMGNFHFDTRG